MITLSGTVEEIPPEPAAEAESDSMDKE